MSSMSSNFTIFNSAKRKILHRVWWGEHGGMHFHNYVSHKKLLIKIINTVGQKVQNGLICFALISLFNGISTFAG